MAASGILQPDSYRGENNDLQQLVEGKLSEQVT